MEIWDAAAPELGALIVCERLLDFCDIHTNIPSYLDPYLLRRRVFEHKNTINFTLTLLLHSEEEKSHIQYSIDSYTTKFVKNMITCNV